MKYGLSLHTEPAAEPISLSEAKKQVEVAEEIVLHDDHLTRLIITARKQFEKQTNRQLITATWDLKLDRFPLWSGDSQNQSTPKPIHLPKCPIQSISAITYTDTSGVTQTVSTSVYKLAEAREPGEVWLKFGQIWPIARFEPDVVNVRFVAGYGDAASDVPEDMKLPMLLMISDWFENRMGEGEVSETANRLMQSCGYGDEFTQYGVPFYAAR